MIKRPLLVVGIWFISGLCILKAAGFPGFGKPVQYKELRKYTSGDVPVAVTGQICQRAEKEKSYQYYIKDAILQVQGKQISDSQTNQKQYPTNQEGKKQNKIGKVSIPGKVVVTVGKEELQQEPEKQEQTIGSLILVQGCLREIEPRGNPGEFDRVSYDSAQGIFYSIWAEQMQVLEKRSDWREQAEQLRERMVKNLKRMMPERYAGILAAILLGDKSGLKPETKLNYEAGAVLHVLSISGLHLTLLGMGLYGLLLRIRAPKAPAAVTAGVIMTGYCCFTGSQPATVRALIMFFVTLGARVSGRSYDPLSAMSLSLILMAAKNHYNLFYSGFQLSFMAVLGAGVVYPVWREGIGKRRKVRTEWQKRVRLLQDQVLACTVITFVTLPLTCRYFYRVSLLGLLPNLLILPTIPAVMIPGVLGIIAGSFSLEAGKGILLPVQVLLKLYELLLEGVRAVPGALHICGEPELWQIFVYYLLVFSATGLVKIRRNDRKLQADRNTIMGKRIAVGALLLSAIVLLLWRAPVTLSITALDVGQGDSIVVRSGKITYLVDGGSSSENQVGSYRILPYLESQGIERLEGILVTHPDGDHINGILEILKGVAEKRTQVRIKQLFLPLWMKGSKGEEQFCVLSEKTGIPIYYLQRGDWIRQGELLIQVLHPDNGDWSEHPNSGSVVLGIHYRFFDALLTGDLEKEGEEGVVEMLRKSDCAQQYEYLKVGHHGSKYSTTDELLEVTHPKIAVISCGKDNNPTQIVIQA